MTRAPDRSPGRTQVDSLDAATRWPMYLSVAGAPLVVLMLAMSSPGTTPDPAPAQLAAVAALAIGQAIAACLLLRAGLAHAHGDRRPHRSLVTATVGLTVAGVVVAVALFGVWSPTAPRFAFGPVAGTLVPLFCAVLTAAVSPLMRARQLAWLVVACSLVAEGCQLLLSGDVGPAWAVNYLVGVGGVAFMFRSSVWVLAILWELRAARSVEAQLAVAEERLRFARDLHDVLGHNLALIAVNSELAARLSRRGEPGAEERMMQVHQIAHDAMREVRQVVAGSRTADLQTELAGARSVLDSAGIRTRMVGEGDVLPAEVQAAFGWVVREATTNIIRHSNASVVRIELDATDGCAVLRLDNDGVVAQAGASGGGTGLDGLSHRLAAVGGTLSTSRTEGDFRLEARIPLAAAAAGAGPVP